MEIDVPDTKKFDIPNVWKFHLLDLWKTDATSIINIEDLPFLLKKWKWLENPLSPISKRIFWIMQTLYYYPALTIRGLITEYMLELGKEGFSTKEYKSIHRKFSMVIDVMIRNGSVTTYEIGRNEVGKGKFTCKIIIAPFADKNDVFVCKEKYIAKGGVTGRISGEIIKKENLKRASEKPKLLKPAKEEKEEIFLIARCSVCGFDQSIKYGYDIKPLIKQGILNPEDTKRLDQNVPCSNCNSKKSRPILNPEVFF